MYITYGYTFRFAWQCHEHVNVYTFKRTLISMYTDTMNHLLPDRPAEALF